MKRVLFIIVLFSCTLISFAQASGGVIKRPSQTTKSTKSHTIQKRNNGKSAKKTESITIDPIYTGTVSKNSLQPVVIFKKGKSNVDDSQLGCIELVATYMRENPNVKILIRGYTYLDGTEKISEERAVAVKTVLVKNFGIDATRLISNGMGATDSLSETKEWNNCVRFYPIITNTICI